MTELKDNYTTILTLMYSKCKSCVMEYRNVLVESLWAKSKPKKDFLFLVTVEAIIVSCTYS